MQLSVESSQLLVVSLVSFAKDDEGNVICFMFYFNRKLLVQAVLSLCTMATGSWADCK